MYGSIEDYRAELTERTEVWLINTRNITKDSISKLKANIALRNLNISGNNIFLVEQ